MGDDKKWLDEADKKYESYMYSCRRGFGGGCRLDGHHILDYSKCDSYKERKEMNYE